MFRNIKTIIKIFNYYNYNRLIITKVIIIKRLIIIIKRFIIKINIVTFLITLFNNRYFITT